MCNRIQEGPKGRIGKGKAQQKYSQGGRLHKMCKGYVGVPTHRYGMVRLKVGKPAQHTQRHGGRHWGRLGNNTQCVAGSKSTVGNPTGNTGGEEE